MDPALRPQDVDRLITDFTERVPGVLHAVVVTSDGVPTWTSSRTR
jgi:predicted regulator of Ras-like GTPase activity (Roadblock/LC7/MglB family)